MDSTFERVESIDGTGEIIMSWAVRRTGRNAYSLSGNLTINPPFTLHPEKYYVRKLPIFYIQPHKVIFKKTFQFTAINRVLCEFIGFIRFSIAACSF